MTTPPSHAPRTVLLACCLLVALPLSGCLDGGDASGDGATLTGDGPTDRNDTPTDRPTVPSDAGPEERALAAEEDYIVDRLEGAPCVESWGLTDYGGIEENATIDERTEDGVYVDASHPYWYGTDRAEVDGGTFARYLVTDDTVQRIEGDDLEPC